MFLDADLVGFDASWVDLLVGALTARPDVVLAKPRYVRAGAGGRVNELVARPILDLLHPDVAGLAQPLGGEYAARRWALDEIELEPDYGVDLGLVIDVAARFGPGAIVEADLGVRRHRNRDLAALGVIARDVLAVALDRAGISARGQAPRPRSRQAKAS